jgi:hydrogenase expression/formation protein HypE
MLTSIERVTLDHGSGGVASRELVEGVIIPRLGEAHGGALEDSFLAEGGAGRLAFTIDSFVLDPIRLGGGVDIGKVAVCGTVNDLAVSGARPRWLGLSFVLEAGLPLDDLECVLDSARGAALEAGVMIVCGDTKVVPRGAIDKMAVTTSGVGVLPLGRRALETRRVRPGDAVILSGYLGDHGLHVLSRREGLGYDERVMSDCAPLNGLMEAMLAAAGEGLRAARDVSRGGFATIANEIAQTAGVDLGVDRAALPIREETALGCEALGADPLHLANEGCLIAFVEASAAPRTVEAMRRNPYGENARIVGVVEAADGPGAVWMTGGGGRTRIQPLNGAVLPRLC